MRINPPTTTLVPSDSRQPTLRSREGRVKTLWCLECSPSSLEPKQGIVSEFYQIAYFYVFTFLTVTVLTWCISVIFPPLKKLYDLQGLQNIQKTGDSPVPIKSPNGIRSPELVANNGKGIICIQWLILVRAIWLVVIFPSVAFYIFEVFKIKKNKLYIKIVHA